jgi:hypothetical protein
MSGDSYFDFEKAVLVNPSILDSDKQVDNSVPMSQLLYHLSFARCQKCVHLPTFLGGHRLLWHFLQYLPRKNSWET